VISSSLKYLPTVGGLILKYFRSVKVIGLEVEEDPESGERYIVFNIELEGEVDDILDQEDCYTAHFVEAVPWPERSDIRLSYDIL